MSSPTQIIYIIKNPLYFQVYIMIFTDNLILQNSKFFGQIFISSSKPVLNSFLQNFGNVIMKSLRRDQLKAYKTKTFLTILLNAFINKDLFNTIFIKNILKR